MQRMLKLDYKQMGVFGGIFICYGGSCTAVWCRLRQQTVDFIWGGGAKDLVKQIILNLMLPDFFLQGGRVSVKTQK